MGEPVSPFFVRNCSISPEFLEGSPKSRMSQFYIGFYICTTRQKLTIRRENYEGLFGRFASIERCKLVNLTHVINILCGIKI